MKKLVLVGAGVSNINLATKLVDNNYEGEIIIIDKGKDPYHRLPSETMIGMLGCGGWSDGKLTYHTEIGGLLSKYCGEDKAMDLMDQVITNFRRFHPKPELIHCSHPTEEPDFIKPYFGLRLFPVWHIGTDYLLQIAQNWYDYLASKNVKFSWECEVVDINFDDKVAYVMTNKANLYEYDFDKLVFGVGKSGIDLSKKLLEKYKISLETKPAQIGVRFEAPQKYFQKLIDVSYDFKLYRKDDKVSVRSFCTNNNAAYVAVEETYGNISYNGHAKKDESYRNDMTNFGILMEIKNIEDPFTWMSKVVEKCQRIQRTSGPQVKGKLISYGKNTGLYYSPSRLPSSTSENVKIDTYQINELTTVIEAFGEYANYILDFINDMNKVFNFGDDWGMYIPEVKYLTGEPLVNYDNLSLKQFPDVYFVGDALSARGITVSGSQGIYVAESLLKN
jgi:uncharacterized FAD-dependent dehydrogenase